MQDKEGVPTDVREILEASRRLHDNRRRLKSLLPSAAFDRIAPALEACEPFGRRADLYGLAADAYRCGCDVSGARSAEELLNLISIIKSLGLLDF